ncbi:MAG: exodeoxyribonuclease VII large subunit [Clostridia bacterium]|nr:exodeoxyribonuclease VII large subunit [Clostridia bacterium]
MRIVSVTSLNMYVKSKLEDDFLLRNLYVKGEISNFKGTYASGHLYFSLKDENACVQAVMFSGSAKSLAFRPENGMKVIVRCRVSLYEKTGGYQIYCDEMLPDGIGELYLAYQQLKDKLEKEGLFDPSRKKPLPRYPMRIGVVTSGSGAARRDIENIISRRFPIAKIIIAPVLVQGDEAPPQIIEAINRFNAKKAADVLIVGRGGGSIEDLWAFNSEGVARAIAASNIPVVSAVGHETDFTIADFVADLRAPTPSAAAELCVPDCDELKRNIALMVSQCKRALYSFVDAQTAKLALLTQKPCLVSMDYYVLDRRARLSMTEKALDDCFGGYIKDTKNKFELCTTRLEAYSPLKILENGFSVVKKNGGVVRSVSQISQCDEIEVRFYDGSAVCRVEKTEKI